MKFSKIKTALFAVPVIAMTGCIEVEDDSNAELTAALQEQNRILNEQLQQQNPSPSVTLSGVVIDAEDEQVLSNASVTVSTPTQVLVENQAVDNGQFVLENLPANSSIELIVKSTDDSFLDRTFYFNSGAQTSGDAVRDIGRFRVSQGEVFSIAVLNSTTNMPIEGLEFRTSSAVGNGSNLSTFDHVSSFDEVNGVYQIEIPKFIDLFIRASIDADGDGQRDFESEDFRVINGTFISLTTSQLAEIDTIRLRSLEEANLRDLKIRLSVVNDGGELLRDATVAIIDENNNIQATFDEDAGQYVLDAKIDDFIRLEIPSFQEETQTYQSSQASIRLLSEGGLQISGSGISSFTVPFEDQVDVVVRASETNQLETDLRTVFIGEPEDETDNALNIFYSLPVEVPNSSISLRNTDAFSVVRGNDDESDAVLPGITVISRGKDIPITATLSLNNTKLNVAPLEDLRPNQSHRYSIGGIQIIGEPASVDLRDDDFISFRSSELGAGNSFDIADLVVDNDNYTTNGVAIRAENTAGEASSVFDDNSRVRVFFPSSITQLQQFNIRLVSHVDDGQTITDPEVFQIVRNGERRISGVNLVSAARNENVQINGGRFSFLLGTAQEDQVGVYMIEIFEFLSDNLSDSENSITLEYAYETKTGETDSGTITLPVQ